VRWGGGVILSLYFEFLTPSRLLRSDVSAEHAGSVCGVTGCGSGEYCCDWEYVIFQLYRAVLPTSI